MATVNPDKIKRIEDKEKGNLHSGHRQKVRNRFYECGFDGMAEHNIIEFLLFFGIPRKDTNEIAHELMIKFRSFSRVLEADREELMKVKGMTENAACLITMILPLYRKYMDDLLSREAELTSINDIVNYLKVIFDKHREQVYMLCFDADHSYIGCKLISEGDIDTATFDIRKVASVVLETNASVVVLAHNHPHGIHLPSSQDIEATKMLKSFLKILKVTLSDHIVVSDTGYCSMLNTPKYTHMFYNSEPLLGNN